MFFLSKWYTKTELSLRMAIFYSGSLISGAFGNLIAAGILNGLAGVRGYSAWQWLYIVEGSITVFVSRIVEVAASSLETGLLDATPAEAMHGQCRADLNPPNSSVSC